MQEAGTLESVSKVTDLGITGDKTCEPIVGDANGWDDLSLAAVLEASLTEDGNLLDDIGWLSIWIRRWEDISVVEEDDGNTLNFTFVDTESASTSDVDMNVIFVVDSSWVLSQVTGLTLSISLVVWGDDVDLLAKISETDGEFVNHDTKTSDS